ncbi:MAG: rhodanese-like domain-containing protein, partial [Chloroflexales bacterium]|nr:rhodanese-like domain-containing protein [Chloroflexales bacterium]
DVREPREFHQGHIPEAILLPLDEILRVPADLPRGRPIVLVCRSGRRSARAAAVLASQGYDGMRILAGGMLTWEAQNLLTAIDT